MIHLKRLLVGLLVLLILFALIAALLTACYILDRTQYSVPIAIGLVVICVIYSLGKDLVG